MKRPIGTVMCFLEGGNKYKIIDFQYNEKDKAERSGIGGFYQLECVDFWCPEDMTDGIMCWKEGDKVWLTSFIVDMNMQVWESVD